MLLPGSAACGRGHAFDSPYTWQVFLAAPAATAGLREQAQPGQQVCSRTGASAVVLPSLLWALTGRILQT